MITLTLSERARQHLATTCKTTADRRWRERCQALLMADRKRRHAQIAQAVGVSTRTLQRWLNASAHRGLAGLTMQWASGRAPHIPAALVPESLTWITHGPAGCGLDRAHWTYAALATSLSQTKGIAVSATTMRTVCSKHGVRPYRPTYRYLKGDPNQQAVARQELTALKKTRTGFTRMYGIHRPPSSYYSV